MFAVADDAYANTLGRRKGTWLGTHNSYTQVSSEVGIPALLFYLVRLFLRLPDLCRFTGRHAAIPRLEKMGIYALGLHYTMIIYAVTVLFEHIAYSLMLPIFGGCVAGLMRVADAEIERVKAMPLAPTMSTDMFRTYLAERPRQRQLGQPVAAALGAFSRKARTLATTRLLSILVPAYNEEEYLAASIQRALDAPLPDGLTSEIVAVDDGSTDGTPEILDELAAQYPGRIRVFHHAANSGKGAAIRTALQHADGEFSHHPGRRPGVRSLRISEGAGPAAVEQGGRGVRVALPDFRRAARDLLLALAGQPPADHGLQYRGGPQPHRHGDVLQGVPHCRWRAASRSAATASGSSRN